MNLCKKWAQRLSVALLVSYPAFGSVAATPDRVSLPGHVPAVVTQLIPQGRYPATNQLKLAIGLPLRNRTELDRLLLELFDPASPNYRKFLTTEEFTARFGPTEEDYLAVQAFALANGLTVAGKHSNRLVLNVEGAATEVERAFGITLRTYRHPTEARDFFAPDTEPSVPANLAMSDMWGLSDYAKPKAMARRDTAPESRPLNYNGTGPSGSYRGVDFRNAYAAGSGLIGSGQVLAVVEFDGYYQSDILNYQAQCGYTNVPLQNVIVDNVSGLPGYSGDPNAVAEVSLDIELAIAIAPGLAKVMVYEGSNPYNVFNKVVTDNVAKQVSCSWAWSTGPSHNWIGRHGSYTLDSILIQMVAQGQAFFQASGDSDAYTGGQALTSSAGPIPVDSIYVTSVGGTTLSMSGTSWSGETVWNWGNNTGSGGGISPNYSIPSWQTNVSMAANGGSTVNRNIPDVAMTAEAIYVIYNNGSSGFFGGTSCAAPLWAGFCALVNQQAVSAGGAPVGFLNPALYAIAAGSNYTNCFHDITTGNNIGKNTPGQFVAVTNYDLATGLGSPNGQALINALAPSAPYFLTTLANQTVTNGANVSFSASAGGSLPLRYSWLCNGTNLASGTNLSGLSSNVLSITSATVDNMGSYQLVVTNLYGAATSSAAYLEVGFAPGIVTPPSSLTVVGGSNGFFTATATGSLPLSYLWLKNGTPLTNGTGISGATSNSLTLTAVSTNSSGNYSLRVTNKFGASTSSAATLTVVLPPALGGTLTNQSVECGNSVAFAASATGTPPLSYQWSLDGAPIAGATSSALSLTNLHLPDHAVSLAVTNLYGSVVSNALLMVRDTLPPVISLIGANPGSVELGGSFSDPGASAADVCGGVRPVAVNGKVILTAVGTNTLSYTADDGNGNTNSVTRFVIVQDTTPPVITWSFTNLEFVADATCSAPMPDVTTTNFVLATDVSGGLTISQSPGTNALLALGTNVVVITVQDASGNAAYSTNTIVVLDNSPPQIITSSENQTNFAGTTTSLTVTATACSPLTYQWWFNGLELSAATNSTLVLSNLTTAAAGTYFAVAASLGGTATSAVAVVAVSMAAPEINLTSDRNPSGYQDSIRFVAAIIPSGGGTIQFLTNGVAFDVETLVAGQAASSPTASLPRGTNLITAIYSGDYNLLPATNVLWQVVTNHAPTAIDAVYARAAGFPLTIPLIDLATNWADPDGDLVTLVQVDAGTNGATVVMAPDSLVYSNANNVPDQFTCTLADGFGGTNVQTINILVTFPVIGGAAVNTDGIVTLNLNGAPGSTCVLQASTNGFSFDNWWPIATNVLSGSGTWQYTDTQAGSFPWRFYRLQQVP